MSQQPGTDPHQISRGMALVQRYKRRRLRSIEECLELQRWLQVAYLDNPAVDPEQRDKARLIYAGVDAVRIDMAYREVLRPEVQMQYRPPD